MFWKTKAQARDRIITYKQVFGTPQGKEVLYDLMNRFHILNPISDSDPQKESKKEGQRQVVLHIFTQCNINIQRLDEMMKEGEHS